MMRSPRLVLAAGVVAAGLALGSPVLSQFPTVPGQPPVPLLQLQRVHGTIQDVNGATLRFVADDGRTLTIDMSQIADDVRGALNPGDTATVVAVPGDDVNRLIARYIQPTPLGEASPRLKE